MVLLQRPSQIALHHGNAIDQALHRLIIRGGGQGAAQIVRDAQQVTRQADRAVFQRLLALALRPAAHVLHLRQGPQLLIFDGGELRLQLRNAKVARVLLRYRRFLGGAGSVLWCRNARFVRGRLGLVVVLHGINLKCVGSLERCNLPLERCARS